MTGRVGIVEQVRLNNNIQSDHFEKKQKKIKFFHFSIDILLYKVVYYKHTKNGGTQMKPQTVEKCKHLFNKIVKENNDLQELSRVTVRMFDIMFECNCESTDEKERSEISKWIRETLLKYCIAKYDDKQICIKDDGTVVIL